MDIGFIKNIGFFVSTV